MSVLVSACISYQLAAHLVLAQNSSSSTSANVAQGAAITVGVLVTCCIIAVVVAKLVDRCYDRQIALSDDASDISEDTRNLVRLRLAADAFRKRKPTMDKDKDKGSAPNEKQRKIIRLWSARAKESRRIAEQRRAEEAAKKLASKDIIRVEEAVGNGKLAPDMDIASIAIMNESSTPIRTPRSPAQPSSRRGTKSESSFGSRTVSKNSPMVSPRSIPKSPVSLVKPEVKKVLSGIDTNKPKDNIGSVNNMSSSGNFVDTSKPKDNIDSLNRLSSTGNLSITLDKTASSGSPYKEAVVVDKDVGDEDTFRSAVDQGQDTVRTDLTPDLIALSCRSRMSQCQTPILDGLHTLNERLTVDNVECPLQSPICTRPGSITSDKEGTSVGLLSETENRVKVSEVEETVDLTEEASPIPTQSCDNDISENENNNIDNTQTVCASHEVPASHGEPENCPQGRDAGKPKSLSSQISPVLLPTDSPRTPSTRQKTPQSAKNSERRSSVVRKSPSPLKIHRRISPRP